jgi:hypothetical protein
VDEEEAADVEPDGPESQKRTREVQESRRPCTSAVRERKQTHARNRKNGEALTCGRRPKSETRPARHRHGASTGEKMGSRMHA